MNEQLAGATVPKIIWSCWFQGEDAAPDIVKAALNSWRRMNPGWDLRVITEHDALAYAPGLARFRLAKLKMTRTAFSDLLRIFLLHEYGGVWADATVFCNKPLDDWFPEHAKGDFFAFSKPPGGGREISTWFLAAGPSSYIVGSLASAMTRYWQVRDHYHHYHWFHKLFNHQIKRDPDFAEAWRNSGSLPASLPLRAIAGGMNASAGKGLVSTETPLYKLTYKYNPRASRPDSLAHHFITHPAATGIPAPMAPRPTRADAPYIATLRVNTNNAGDHIQIIAAERKLRHFGLAPDVSLDRDQGLGSAPELDRRRGKATMLMNGWFKRGDDEWPPSPGIDPIFVSFHVRPHRSAAIFSTEGLDYLKQHEPIGCRDEFTTRALGERGVKADETNCMTLTFSKRIRRTSQDKVFVVSRDKNLSEIVRPHVGEHVHVDHYTNTSDHRPNMRKARELLALYADNARLVVTSLLHCAMPCIAMGIPVIVFYPEGSAAGHRSDRERFSSLAKLTRIHRITDVDTVDWSPAPIDVGSHKLALVDRIRSELEKRGLAEQSELGPFISIDDAAALIAAA